MKSKIIVGIICGSFILIGLSFAQETQQKIELPELDLEQKWKRAESNLIYFIVCGITFAKANGFTPEEYGTHTGEVAAPGWGQRHKGEVAYLVRGISRNKQQFSNFQMEILSESDTAIKAKMKGFGEIKIGNRLRHEISSEDYIRFFGKKWEVIADHLELVYEQEIEGEWLNFTVSKK
jgi:hypothetical protein